MMQEFYNHPLKVVDIILAESTFKRRKKSYNPKDFKNHLDIDINIEEKANQYYVTLILKYQCKSNDNIVMDALISMVGIFELTDEKPVYLNEFLKVNAPAIIYPFIREHLHSLSNKAGYEGINLPPFNFVAFSQKYFIEKHKELNKANS
jgi:preprotein translocase subunit SecB